MPESNNEGYALKKSIIRKWIYEYGYTQKMIACALHITKQEFNERLEKRKKFTKDEIGVLSYLMGAEWAFYSVYFPTTEDRNQTYYDIFGTQYPYHKQNYHVKKKRTNYDRKRNKHKV